MDPKDNKLTEIKCKPGEKKIIRLRSERFSKKIETEVKGENKKIRLLSEKYSKKFEPPTKKEQKGDHTEVRTICIQDKSSPIRWPGTSYVTEADSQELSLSSSDEDRFKSSNLSKSNQDSKTFKGRHRNESERRRSIEENQTKQRFSKEVEHKHRNSSERKQRNELEPRQGHRHRSEQEYNQRKETEPGRRQIFKANDVRRRHDDSGKYHRQWMSERSGRERVWSESKERVWSESSKVKEKVCSERSRERHCPSPGSSRSHKDNKSSESPLQRIPFPKVDLLKRGKKVVNIQKETERDNKVEKSNIKKFGNSEASKTEKQEIEIKDKSRSDEYENDRIKSCQVDNDKYKKELVDEAGVYGVNKCTDGYNGDAIDEDYQSEQSQIDQDKELTGNIENKEMYETEFQKSKNEVPKAEKNCLVSEIRDFEEGKLKIPDTGENEVNQLNLPEDAVRENESISESVKNSQGEKHLKESESTKDNSLENMVDTSNGSKLDNSEVSREMSPRKSDSSENQEKMGTNQPHSEYEENLEEGELQPSEFTIVDEVGESEDTEPGENSPFQTIDDKQSECRRSSTESKTSKRKSKDYESKSGSKDYEKRRESIDKKYDKRRNSYDEMKYRKSPIKGKHDVKKNEPQKSSSECSRHRSDRTRSRSRHRHSDRSTSSHNLKERNRHKSSEDRRSRHGSSRSDTHSLAERVAEASIGKAEGEKNKRDRIGISIKRERDWDRGKRRSTDIRDRRRSSELLLGPPVVKKEKREDDKLGISSFLREVRETSKEEKPALTLDDLGNILKGQNPIGWVNLNAQKWNYYPQFTEMGALKPTRFGQGQIFQCSLKVKDFITNGTGRSKKEAKNECYKAMVLLLAAPKKPKPVTPNRADDEASAAAKLKQEPTINQSSAENAPVCSGALPSLVAPVCTGTLPSLVTMPPVLVPPSPPQPWFYSQEILSATSSALFGHPISLLMERQMKLKLPPPEFQCEKQSSFNIYSWHGFKPDFIFSCAILLNRGDPRVYFGRGATKKEGKFQAALAVFADVMGIADQMHPVSPASTSDQSSVAASSATSSKLGSASTSSLSAPQVFSSTSSLPNSLATTSSIVKNNDPLYSNVIEKTAFVPASDQEMAQVTHPVGEMPEETPRESSEKLQVSNMKVAELRQELEKRNLVSKGTRAMLTARLEEAIWQEEVSELRTTLEKKGLSTKGTKEELATRLEEALLTELIHTLQKRNLSTEGTKEELSARLEKAIITEKHENKMEAEKAESSNTELQLQTKGEHLEHESGENRDNYNTKEKIENEEYGEEEDRVKRELELKEKLEASVREKKEAKSLYSKSEIETTKAALNKIESSMELTDEEKSLIAKKLKAGLRKSRKSSDSILEDLFHDLEKKLAPKKAKKHKRDRSTSPKHVSKKKSRKTKVENEEVVSFEDHKLIKRKPKKDKKDKRRKSSERSLKKSSSNSDSEGKDMEIDKFVVVDAVGEVDDLDENVESHVAEDKLLVEHDGETTDIPEKIFNTNINEDEADESTPVKIDLENFKFSKTINNSPNTSKSKFGLDPEEYRKKYFGLVGFPIPSSSKSGELDGLPTTTSSKCGELDGLPTTTNSKCGELDGLPTTTTSKCGELDGLPSATNSKCGELDGLTTSNKCGEEIKNESEISSPSNTYLDCGAEVKEERDSFKTNSVDTVDSTQSKYNISKPFETDKNELMKKEWPLFSFGQAPVSCQDEKRIDKGETKGNLVKHQSEVKKPLLFETVTEKKEKLDNIEPCANLASFSFVKTIKDEKKANSDNNSSFASFTFVKPGDVKTKKVGPEYIETSSEDSKSVINETLKLIEEADDTKSSEIENALSSFRFVKSSIKKETLNDLGKKTVENCKDSSDQSNDPKTSDSKYFANLFNFNIPKANTVFRSIKATGSIFDQNLLDLGMKVELNDKDEREVQMKKSCFHKM